MNIAPFSDSTYLTYHTKITSWDTTHYWPFPREYSVWNAAVAALQCWTQQCHWKSLHSILLQWLSTAAKKTARGNNIWLLHDHLKWCFWMRTCIGRWRLWEWKLEFKYTHSSQKSTTDIPHFHKWEFVFQPYHTTYHSWTTPSSLTSKTQKPHSGLLPFSIQQFWWGESCENWYTR